MAQAQMRRAIECGVPDNQQYLHPLLAKNYGNWKYHDRPRPGVLHHVSHSGDEVWTAKSLEARLLDPASDDAAGENQLGAVLTVASTTERDLGRRLEPAGPGETRHAGAHLRTIARIRVTHVPRPGAIARSRVTAATIASIARSTSASVLKRPRLKRSVLCASRSLRPRARST